MSPLTFEEVQKYLLETGSDIKFVGLKEHSTYQVYATQWNLIEVVPEAGNGVWLWEIKKDNYRILMRATPESIQSVQSMQVVTHP